MFYLAQLEVKRKLEEERDMESMKDLQEGAGLITKKEKDRVDWMYQGQGAYIHILLGLQSP